MPEILSKNTPRLRIKLLIIQKMGLALVLTLS